MKKRNLYVRIQNGKSHTKSIPEKQKNKRGIKMIKNEEYIQFLKSIISCIDNGDYYSIKELAYLKLEEIQNFDNNSKNARI